MPCVLNAANEIAVEAFLKDKIGFLEMPGLLNTAWQKCIISKTRHLKIT
jgi:1-deoxy-D-xylulose-5-phosphate reductoisomerase